MRGGTSERSGSPCGTSRVSWSGPVPAGEAGAGGRAIGVREATLTIDRLAYGGSGFGRIDGKACFVPFTAPGDQVRVRVCRETASYVQAEVIELLERSPLRIDPPCPLHGRCGGCHWQHLTYPAQVAAKGEIFAESLWRLARVERDLLLPPLAADAPWGYRSRVQLKLYGRERTFRIGFFAPGSHYVIDLPASGCAVAMPAINEALAALRPVVEEFPERDRLPQIDLAAGEDGALLMTVHYTGDEPERTVRFWRSRRERLAPVRGACLQRGRKSTLTGLFGEERLAYGVPAAVAGDDGAELGLTFSAGSFSQVNYRQNRALVRTALQWAGLTGRERLLDLCCGNGNFTLPLARHAGGTVGLETGESAVADARRNAASLGIDTARFEVADGATGLRRFIAGGERFDLVVLDPPRSGAAEMAGLIAGVAAERLLYVSCDPQTLGRDLARLRKGGFRTVRSRVVEMFPQTYHIESITLLERD